MSDERVLQQLTRLYELAKVRPGEERDEGRLNEARNAAAAMVKLATKHDIPIHFGNPKSTIDGKRSSSVDPPWPPHWGPPPWPRRSEPPPPPPPLVEIIEIHAQYSGSCLTCRCPYRAGDCVQWIKGKGCLHLGCPYVPRAEEPSWWDRIREQAKQNAQK